ncbi:DUF459 domain-containing protein [uncultured Gilliamella sp.]|uniref:SGNH/GDSL hydrolase family protein n=1 Tax=uncultured Gilliamella sp. TaxID=1193505 RepID=UPI0025F332B7|nr:DUF459 domain-containing protein [uncultured Gilliamella sp.]
MSLKFQYYNFSNENIVQQSNKLEKTNNNLFISTEKSLSARNIFVLLTITAIGLMVVYYNSILIYWQQTYHFELLNTNTLTTQNTLEDEPKPVKIHDKNNEENSSVSKDNILVQVHSYILPQFRKKKSNTAALPSKTADKNNKTKESVEQNAIKNETVNNHSNPNSQETKDDNNINQPMLQSTALPDKISEIIAIYKPLPIFLTEKDKVLFAGDSLMQGVAPHVKKMLFKKYKIESVNFSKQSTGLAYPSAFDWPKTINDNIVADPSIKLLVMFLGPNDPWDFPVKGYAKFARFKSELWEQQYRLRIATILHIAKEHNVQVLWLAAPCMRKPKLNEGMVYLNTLYKSELEKTQQHFLTTNELLGCTYEKFSNFIETNKVKIKVRVDDGIHFTPSGQKILANAIMEKITFKDLEDTDSD